MTWIRSSTSVPHVPAPTVSPEQSQDDRVPDRLRAEAFNLIDVTYARGGSWKAICECGEAPELFEKERAAWQWVMDHRCPVIEDDARAV